MKGKVSWPPLNLTLLWQVFWEFVKLWKAKRNCKLVLSSNEGQGEVQLVAGLGVSEDLHHLPQKVHVKRKKSPSQMRREEKRRQDRAERALESRQVSSDEHRKAEEVTNVLQDESVDTNSDNHSKNKMEAVFYGPTVSDVVCTDEVLTEEIDEYEEARNIIV